MSQFVLLILVGVLMAIGILGAFIPVFPSTPLIFAGAFVYALFTGFREVTGWVLAWLAFLTVASQLLDYFAAVYGAKKLRASNWGMGGAIVGALFGLFAGGLVGVIIGPFVGAFAFELLFARRQADEALRAGLGALLGTLGGMLGKLIIGLVMCGVFLWAILR
jgi:uncharacterized protein YqgC (DUF456 family)